EDYLSYLESGYCIPAHSENVANRMTSVALSLTVVNNVSTSLFYTTLRQGSDNVG
ncbi:hypothetical protein Bpfe_003552, partial [Biomphalaria pfeifferi]